MEYTPDVTQPDKVETAVNNGTEVQVKDAYNNVRRSKPMEAMTKPEVLEDNTVYPDYNGTFLPIGGINEMLHPEMFEQGIFRQGQLSVVGEEELLKRKVTLLRVDLLSGKRGDCQKFWIDNETGIVLKTEIYKKDKVMQSMAFESVDFISGFNDSKFELN